jgi:exopolyphosphatase / guanosine-5'-triphosphate,3'-diphosphate pyrophosphatase
MRKAVIDIGTNTFNLLVADQMQGQLKIVHESKLPVKLGKGSMNDGMLKPDAMERAIEAINQHKKMAEDLGATEIKAFATSAVRNAKNQKAFVETINVHCSLQIEVIDGDREARLIYNGVRLAVPMKPGTTYLILDIGGGSNEFILCNNKQILWKKSYDLGIARMLEKIYPSDPISQKDIEQLKNITNSLIPDLVAQCHTFNPTVLIGASGSFETFLSMILHQNTGNDAVINEVTSMPIDLDGFNALHEKLVASTHDQRLSMPGLPVWRADMIVLAAVFTIHITDLFSIQQMTFSNYALKEGVVGEGFE